MSNVILKLLHNGAMIKEIDYLSLDDMHKIIGIMSYGGWKDGDTKYIVDDYYIWSFTPLVIHVNVQTEAEFNKKTVAQLAGLSQGFQDRLVPAFNRKTRSDLN